MLTTIATSIALLATLSVPEQPATAPERRVALRIEPRQPVWEAGDCIIGSVVLTNTGLQSITIGQHELPPMRLVLEDGTTPPELPEVPLICGTGMAGMGITLEPGATGRIKFAIETAIDNMVAGYEAPPATYTLELAAFVANANIVVTDPGRASTITIVPAPPAGEPGPPVELALSRDQMAVLRRDGTIDRFDAESMQLLARARIDGWTLPKYLSSFDFKFSPDLAMVAWTEDDFDGGRTLVHIVVVPTTGPLQIPVARAAHCVAAVDGKSPFVAGFDERDGGVFVGEYEGTLLKLHPATGDVMQRWDLGGRPVVSPDGQHLGWECRAYAPYYMPDPRRGPPAYGWGPHSDPNQRLAYDGGYAFDLTAAGVVLDSPKRDGWQLRSFDDRLLHEIPSTDNGWLITASPDGRTFVYRENIEPEGEAFRTEFRLFEFGDPNSRWTWAPRGDVPEIAYSQDSRVLVLTYDRRGGYRHWLEDVVEILDVETGEISRRIVIPRPGIDDSGVPRVNRDDDASSMPYP